MCVYISTSKTFRITNIDKFWSARHYIGSCSYERLKQIVYTFAPDFPNPRLCVKINLIPCGYVTLTSMHIAPQTHCPGNFRIDTWSVKLESIDSRFYQILILIHSKKWQVSLSVFWREHTKARWFLNFYLLVVGDDRTPLNRYKTISKKPFCISFT